MPALNAYAFETLVHIAQAAREAFLTAALRAEADIENYAGATVTEAFAASKEHPEKLALLTDAYLTALSGRKGAAFNGAFERAKQTLGRDDMVDGLILSAALGHRPDPKSGASYNEASYR